MVELKHGAMFVLRQSMWDRSSEPRDHDGWLITSWIVMIRVIIISKKSQPLRELMPALMISSTKSKLEAITVHEFTICLFTLQKIMLASLN